MGKTNFAFGNGFDQNKPYKESKRTATIQSKNSNKGKI